MVLLVAAIRSGKINKKRQPGESNCQGILKRNISQMTSKGK